MAKTLLTALFAITAFASPIEERGINCNALNAVVSVMHAQNVATPFCSSLLKIPTITATSVVTSTPPIFTVTTSKSQKLCKEKKNRLTSCAFLGVSSTATVTTISTSVVYAVTTVYPVVAISTTSTCALGATVVQKRNVWPTPIGTPTCLTQWTGASLTSACSCLSIPTPTSVVVSTKTLPTSTVRQSESAAFRTFD